VAKVDPKHLVLALILGFFLSSSLHNPIDLSQPTLMVGALL